MTINLIINGKEHEIKGDSTIESLLVTWKLDARQVAVERNREIVPRASYGTTALVAGDILEIVTFVGGG